MISDTMLRGYVQGVLDPTEMAMVADWVSVEPVLALRMESMKRDLVHTAGFVLPLPAVGWMGLGTATTGAQADMVMGGAQMAPLAALQLEVGQSLSIPLPEAAPEDAMVVCMQRAPGSSWKVVFPNAPHEVTTKQVFARPDAGHQVRVVVGEPVGLHEWVVWAVDSSIAIDWSKDEVERWQPVLDAHAAGDCWRADVRVEVTPDSDRHPGIV